MTVLQRSEPEGLLRVYSGALSVWDLTDIFDTVAPHEPGRSHRYKINDYTQAAVGADIDLRSIERVARLENFAALSMRVDPVLIADVTVDERIRALRSHYHLLSSIRRPCGSFPTIEAARIWIRAGLGGALGGG